jgi:hypothetical protein
MESRGAHRYRSYANKPVMIMKRKKEKRCILILHSRDEKCHEKRGRKETKIKRVFYTSTVQRI